MPRYLDIYADFILENLCLQTYQESVLWTSILSTVSRMKFFILFLSAVVVGRAEPQQPSEQSGCAALSGKQEGV